MHEWPVTLGKPEERPAERQVFLRKKGEGRRNLPQQKQWGEASNAAPTGEQWRRPLCPGEGGHRTGEWALSQDRQSPITNNSSVKGHWVLSCTGDSRQRRNEKHGYGKLIWKNVTMAYYRTKHYSRNKTGFVLFFKHTIETQNAFSRSSWTSQSRYLQGLQEIRIIHISSQVQSHCEFVKIKKEMTKKIKTLHSSKQYLNCPV